jgi:hypothetical protein
MVCIAVAEWWDNIGLAGGAILMLDPAVLEALRWVSEAAALLVLIGIVLFLRVEWADIPPVVPCHFGITGKPDRHGRRWRLLLLAAVSLALYVGMSIGGHTADLVLGISSQSPSQDFALTWVKFSLQLMMGFTLWTSVRVAQGRRERMNVLVMLALVVVLIAPAILVMSRR